MRQPIKSSVLKRLIIVLAVLLALSLTALCIVLAQRRSAPTAELSGNRITAQTMAYTQAVPQRAAGKTLSASTSTGNATGIVLDKSAPDYKGPFHVDNMFPGDGTKEGDPNIHCDYRDYRIRVYHTGTVTVHFKADIQDAYKPIDDPAPDAHRLSEVLGIRVKVRESGSSTWTVLYEGLMCKMPDSVDTQLTGDYLDYQMTPYLSTSVGNEYMYKDLKADFHWWVEGTGSGGNGGNGGGGELIDGPKTGDTFQPLLWGGLAVCAIAGIGVVVVLRRRKEGRA